MRNFLLIFSMILGLSFVGCGKQTTTQSVQQIDSYKYTYDMYKKIETGMSYEQVKGILGEGTEQASSEDKSIDLVIKAYSWQNKDGSNISITFENDKVSNKAQAGLK